MGTARKRLGAAVVAGGVIILIVMVMPGVILKGQIPQHLGRQSLILALMGGAILALAVARMRKRFS